MQQYVIVCIRCLCAIASFYRKLGQIDLSIKYFQFKYYKRNLENCLKKFMINDADLKAKIFLELGGLNLL